MNGVPDCFDPTPPPPQTFFPSTCLAIKTKVIADTGVSPTDGTYMLYVGGDSSKPWLAYCRRMNLVAPSEYLTVDDRFNVSQISNGVAVASTSYRRYRIDPATLKIDPLDDAFASNTGFDAFTPVLPAARTSIPAGWAEFQPFRMDDGPAAQSQVSLAGTPFTFAATVLDNGLAFFCRASDLNTMNADTTGSGASVAAALDSFGLTAINSNPSNAATGVYTRTVADCDDLGPTAVTFDTASWPLTYSP